MMTTPNEALLHQPFQAMAQGVYDHTLEAFPIPSDKFGVMLTIATPDAAVYVTQEQAAKFFGFAAIALPVEPTAQPDEWVKKAIALCQHWANCARDLPPIEEYRAAKAAAIKHLQTAQIAPPPVAGDASGWQPIETAPKTGRTLLLGYFNSHNNWRVVRGEWVSAAVIADEWEDGEDAPEGWYETVVESDDMPNCWKTEPDYWMPLPPPPVAAIAAGGKT